MVGAEDKRVDERVAERVRAAHLCTSRRAVSDSLARATAGERAWAALFDLAPRVQRHWERGEVGREAEEKDKEIDRITAWVHPVPYHDYFILNL